MSYRYLYGMVAALLAILIWMWWSWPQRQWQKPDPVSPEIPHIVEREGGSEPSLVSTGEAIARPIFWVTRRPMSREVVAVEEENDIDGAIVVGLLRRDEGAVAIIQDSEGKASRVVAGQDFGGWKLLEIQDDVAVFQRAGGEKRSLRITRRRVEDLPLRAAQGQTPPAASQRNSPQQRPQPVPQRRPQPPAGTPQQAPQQQPGAPQQVQPPPR